ncbi:unnamed protein product [Sphenostylis stenocarpa]|uniref:Pentatricopeptide repeat-containing protein n=1 Tax=Sphenostylis stenocarpa TaxID=92480 RepID=A0AA86THM3_9FABA|nr:unnamed protein product [Sphenostylis stenocarpa]
MYGKFDVISWNCLIWAGQRAGHSELALELFHKMRDAELLTDQFTCSMLMSVSIGDSVQLFKEQDQWDSALCNLMISGYARHDLGEDALRLLMLTLRKSIRPTEYMVSSLLSAVIASSLVDIVSSTMDLFRELLTRGGTLPDRITLTAVVLACNYGLLVDEGIEIFSSMEIKFGVKPGEEHYECVVAMLSKVGKLKEAIDIIETKPYRSTSDI